MWADVFAAAFVLLVLRGWMRPEGFSPGLMSGLAALAGFCLLTRVSTAVGLYVALGLLWLWRASQEVRAHGVREALSPLAKPALILLGFAAAAAMVNQQRWGDPLVFVDLNRSLISSQNGYHDPLLRDYGAFNLRDYGEFNPARLGFGLVYYLFPIWVLRDASGQLLWSSFVGRAMSTVELPPSSFFVSDPLIIALAIYGAARLPCAGAGPQRTPLVLATAGLAVPIGLMLMAMAMTFRYRMEFYPVLELWAFVGFCCLPAAPATRIKMAFAGAGLTSMAVALFLWLLYMLSPFGLGAERLGQRGIVEFYRCMLHPCDESTAPRR